MLYIRLSPGLANSLMEFCAGYALAKELNEDNVILDVGECQNTVWGFLLDQLCIPNYKKITYFLTDSNEIEHSSVKSIPTIVRENAIVLNKSNYSNLCDSIHFSNNNQSLYMSDFFFDSARYYSKYWSELKKMFVWRGENSSIDAFKAMIRNKTSIAIHVRRGDMLKADFAIDITDGYYRAAVEWCRKKIDPEALFCVFSDDISYAEKILGYDERIKYVHLLGYDDADLAEFICLSLCDYRIVSNNSTYSIVADRINGDSDRITIYQGNVKSSLINHIRARIHEGLHMIKGRFLNTKEPRIVFLDKHDIDRYERWYSVGEKTSEEFAKRMDRIHDICIRSDGVEDALNEIQDYELNHFNLSIEDEFFLRLKKYEALFLKGDYENAICIADSIWGKLWNDDSFRMSYSKVLSELGVVDESTLLEYKPQNAIHYIIFSGIESRYSTLICGLGELSIALSKMGQMVTIVENPADETEEYYINSNRYLTNRRGVMSGCKQYSTSDVEACGIRHFIERIINEESQELVVVVSRVPDVFADRVEGVTYVFPDYQDDKDPEREYEERFEGEKSIRDVISHADFILTARPETYLDGIRSKLIKYNVDKNVYPYWEVDSRWKWQYAHRVSKRTIDICKALEDRIQESIPSLCMEV